MIVIVIVIVIATQLRAGVPEMRTSENEKDYANENEEITIKIRITITRKPSGSMLQLSNRELTIDLLDPVADAARQGGRYCWGGYIWQVHDATLGPLVSGPAFPCADPPAFDGQGLPESFRHRRRGTNAPFTWSGKTGLAIGVGILAAGEGNAFTLTEPCRWTITPSADHIIFQTRQAAAGFSYELARKIELRDRTVTSSTQLTNVGETPLALEWFAHPFWPLTAGRARLQLPAGTSMADNPGFALADGVLTFKRAFVAKEDDQFSLLMLPHGEELTVGVDHPVLSRVTFATSFVPDECPAWANAHTISVEPYQILRLAPGATRHWHVRYGFVANSGTSVPVGNSVVSPAR